MRERSHRCRWRLLGALAVGVYLAGGLGPAGGALAALLRGAAAPAPGACGCTEGAACCGAACCAPVGEAHASAPLPDCCLPPGVASGGSCCDEPPAATTVADPADVLAFVARCTCGHRDQQSAGVHLPDAHLPSPARVGACPPPAARQARERDTRAGVWSPEPRDGVPKPPCIHA